MHWAFLLPVAEGKHRTHFWHEHKKPLSTPFTITGPYAALNIHKTLFSLSRASPNVAPRTGRSPGLGDTTPQTNTVDHQSLKLITCFLCCHYTEENLYICLLLGLENSFCSVTFFNSEWKIDDLSFHGVTSQMQELLSPNTKEFVVILCVFIMFLWSFITSLTRKHIFKKGSAQRKVIGDVHVLITTAKMENWEGSEPDQAPSRL